MFKSKVSYKPMYYSILLIIMIAHILGSSKIYSQVVPLKSFGSNPLDVLLLFVLTNRNRFFEDSFYKEDVFSKLSPCLIIINYTCL